MNFQQPIWLLLLIAVLLLIGLYFVLQLRRKKYAVRFTNVDLLDKIAPKRPGWRRHIAFALIVAALGFFSMAMAVPATEVQVPRNRATVCLALDVSLSMKASDVKPSRFEAMKKSAAEFVDKLPAGINLALVSFGGAAVVNNAPTTDRSSVKSSIAGLELQQSTATGDAIYKCLATIQAFAKGSKTTDGKPIPARIVLESDGKQTVGQDVNVAAASAKEAKIPISTIAFGTPGGAIVDQGQTIPVPVDTETMKSIASATGGTYFAAGSAGELSDAYKNIGEQIGYTNEFRAITLRFVGIGLVLAFCGAAAALFWTNRLI
ncbi:MAG: VWA domain-containing protein [Antricoccus sp.]